jgi:diguanylate cyclase
MGEDMLPTSVNDNTESLCAIVIETLKSIKPSSCQPITPRLLCQELSEKKEYLDLIRDLREARGEKSPIQESDIERYVRNLQDFRLGLLTECENAFDEEYLGLATILRESISKSNTVRDILGFNDELLDLFRTYARKVNSELEQSTDIVEKIGSNLMEMESELLSSFSHTREIYENSKAFNNILETNVEDIAETIHISKTLAELRGFVASKILDLRDTLKNKRKSDELQIKKVSEEVRQLKNRIRRLKKEIDRVQNVASALEKETLIDSLTGIYNRRAYEKYFREQCMLFQRFQQVFSILLVDVNEFKSINDTYGHWAGDRCLEELAKMMRTNLRGTDFLARYGGDEFVAILPATSEEGASITAGKLRQLIGKSRFCYRDQRIPLSIAIGCATIRPSDENAEAVFNRADAALYEAKESGRGTKSLVASDF